MTKVLVSVEGPKMILASDYLSNWLNSLFQKLFFNIKKFLSL